jgi:hypothetical protein
VSTSSGMRHTEVCISVVTPHFCPPVDDTQFRMMSWGMIMPEHIAPYPFVLPHRIANNRTSLLQGSHKSANGSSAMGNSLSSNQVSFSHRNFVVPQEHRCIRTVKRTPHVYALLTYLITAGIA